MKPELLQVSSPMMPLYACECKECPCLMHCEIFEYPLCQFCKKDNHQEEGTIGAKEFAKEVQQQFNQKVFEN